MGKQHVAVFAALMVALLALGSGAAWLAPPARATPLTVDGGPTSPTVTFVPGETTIDLSWTPIEGVSRYRYRVRRGSAGWSSNVQVDGLSTTIRGLQPDRAYTVAVGAQIDGRWRNSWTEGTVSTGVESTTDTTDTTDTTVPSEPPPVSLPPEAVVVNGAGPMSPGVTVIPTHASLSLWWDEVPSANRYQYRYRERWRPWSRWMSGEGSAEVPGLDPETLHSVQVRARVAGRWQRATAVTLATLEAPPAPVPELPGHGPHPVPTEWLPASDETATYVDDREPLDYFLIDPDDVDDETWGPTRIGWLVKCESVKFEQIDPIAQPGVLHGHHLHEFFGNPNVHPDTTTQSLFDTPLDDVECTDRNDKSAYWSPVVYQDGVAVAASNISVYYKSTTPDVVPMPDGLRMIAGNAGATSNQSSDLVGYWMTREPSTEEVFSSIGATEMITPHRPGVPLMLRLNFPNCWDGVHLDSPDHQSHMAYFDEETATCPPSHPVKVPQVTTFTFYDDIEAGSGFALASGPWYTFHQDFWNAWSPDQMADLTSICLVDGNNCRINPTRWLLDLGQQERTVPTVPTESTEPPLE